MSVSETIDRTIGKEGAYSNHPNDTGGETMWGITERVARRNGYKGPMRELPRATAVSIYRSEYYEAPGFAEVAKHSEAIAEKLFDTGVNTGPARPCFWLQEWLNALNNGGRLYADIKEDGDIGPATLRALAAYMKARGKEAEHIMLHALSSDQTCFYKSISRSRQPNESFTFGWLRRVWS